MGPRGAGAVVLHGPRWQRDAVLAAELAFLLPAATAAACRAPDPAAAARGAALPLLLLLARHPQPALCASAHACFATLVAHLANGGGNGGPSSPAVQQQQEELARLAAQAVPYWVQRSLQLPWRLATLEAFEKALPAVLRALPPGAAEARLCARHVLWCALRFYESAAAATAPPLDFAALYSGGGPAGPPGAERRSNKVRPAAKLVGIACGLLLLVDWPEVPGVAAALAEVVRAAGRSRTQQVALLQFLHDLLLRSDDYARKGALAEWFQGLLGPAGGWQAVGDEEQEGGWRARRELAGRFASAAAGGAGAAQQHAGAEEEGVAAPSAASARWWWWPWRRGGEQGAPAAGAPAQGVDVSLAS